MEVGGIDAAESVPASQIFVAKPLSLTDTGGALIDTRDPLKDMEGHLSGMGSPPAETGGPLDPNGRPWLANDVAGVYRKLLCRYGRL